MKQNEYCTDRVLHGYCGAWFSGITGTKVDSLRLVILSMGLSKLHPNWQIVVEADGAKENGSRRLRRVNLLFQALQRLRLVLLTYKC